MELAESFFGFVFFFFFKQKTAYEIVSGDWSSDVCSSDLGPARSSGPDGGDPVRPEGGRRRGPVKHGPVQAQPTPKHRRHPQETRRLPAGQHRRMTGLLAAAGFEHGGGPSPRTGPVRRRRWDSRAGDTPDRSEGTA